MLALGLLSPGIHHPPEPVAQATGPADFGRLGFRAWFNSLYAHCSLPAVMMSRSLKECLLEHSGEAAACVEYMLMQTMSSDISSEDEETIRWDTVFV